MHFAFELCIVISAIIMKSRIRHTVVTFLLLSYVFLGVIGHLEVLIVLGLGTNPHQLAQAKACNPPSTKAYWTQYKHISTAVKISIPYPVILITPQMHHSQGIEYTTDNPRIILEPYVSLHSSRAPPRI